MTQEQIWEELVEKRQENVMLNRIIDSLKDDKKSLMSIVINLSKGIGGVVGSK